MFWSICLLSRCCKCFRVNSFSNPVSCVSPWIWSYFALDVSSQPGALKHFATLETLFTISVLHRIRTETFSRPDLTLKVCSTPIILWPSASKLCRFNISQSLEALFLQDCMKHANGNQNLTINLEVYKDVEKRWSHLTNSAFCTIRFMLISFGKKEKYDQDEIRLVWFWMHTELIFFNIKEN